MNQTINPYQPPATLPTTRNRVSEITRLIRRLPLIRYFAFRRGDVVIVDGIAFYVDPNNSSVLFAASPSTKTTDERMNLVVAETIRVLPYLFSRRPGLKRLIRGRTLIVRLVGSYAETRCTVFREFSLDWDTAMRRIQDGGEPSVATESAS